MAHIHSGKKGENGDVVVVLFKSDTPTGPMNGTLAQGNFTATDLKGPMAGKTIQDLSNSNEEWGNLCQCSPMFTPKLILKVKIEARYQ
jgi:hypothetical protein